MASMYETIRDLPLLKGIGEEQLSLMLEKTSLEFLKFEEGEVICEKGADVKSVDFILSGKVTLSYFLNNFQIEISEVLGKGNIMGAMYLFGRDTKYMANAKAMSKVSLMRINKPQYLNILNSDPIYMINYLNYLSAAAQKAPSMLLELPKNNISRKLYSIVYTVVSRMSERAAISGEDKEIAELCGIDLKDFQEWKKTEEKAENIIVNSEGIIILKK